jgi:hypothetical protein
MVRRALRFCEGSEEEINRLTTSLRAALYEPPDP